jgi:transcriptional regulator with GAF, ATPase, and Fis domain
MKSENKVDENVFFREATLRICSSLDLLTAMRQCMDYLQTANIPVSGLMLVCYFPDINAGSRLVHIFPPYIQEPPRVHIYSDNWKKPINALIRQPKSIYYFNDVKEMITPFREVLPLYWPGDDHSMFFMHLKLEKRVGGVFLFAEGKNQYTEYHAHLMSLLNEPFAIALSKSIQHQEVLELKDRLVEHNRYLQQQLFSSSGDTIVGVDQGLKSIMETVRQVAPLKNPITLLGETGVGKEVIANAIHYGSSCSGGPFIKVNCGAIPESLIDSELFGYEKGAFTGAVSSKQGYFERAHTGTIFLDEIGELPLAVQVRLLRVLQQHEIQRVGGTQMIPVNIRLICATHRNLEEMVQFGQFRKDLWFRINVFPIRVPPLRERSVDIPALVVYFIERKMKELGLKNKPRLAPGAIERLQAYHWPGNVRELENVVERALIYSQLHGDKKILQFDKLLTDSLISQENISAGELGRSFLTLDQAMANHIHGKFVLPFKR